MDDEETQDFSWLIRAVSQPPPDVERLCLFLVEHQLVSIDAITIPVSQLIALLVAHGWQRDRATECLDYILSTEVKMVDDGAQTDSFFLHF